MGCIIELFTEFHVFKLNSIEIWLNIPEYEWIFKEERKREEHDNYQRL